MHRRMFLMTQKKRENERNGSESDSTGSVCFTNQLKDIEVLYVAVFNERRETA